MIYHWTVRQGDGHRLIIGLFSEVDGPALSLTGVKPLLKISFEGRETPGEPGVGGPPPAGVEIAGAIETIEGGDAAAVTITPTHTRDWPTGRWRYALALDWGDGDVRTHLSGEVRVEAGV